MFDTRERCVDCLGDFTVFWGDVDTKTGKRTYYGTSKPAVFCEDGKWRCRECRKLQLGMHASKEKS